MREGWTRRNGRARSALDGLGEHRDEIGEMRNNSARAPTDAAGKKAIPPDHSAKGKNKSKKRKWTKQ